MTIVDLWKQLRSLDEEPREDAFAVIEMLLERVRGDNSTSRTPLSKPEIRRIRTALRSLLRALEVAQQLNPAYWQLVEPQAETEKVRAATPAKGKRT